MKKLEKSRIAHSDYLSNGMYAVWTDGYFDAKKNKYLFDADIFCKETDEKPFITVRGIWSYAPGVTNEFPDMLDYLEGLVSEDEE